MLGDDFLSQDELDSLLNGLSDDSSKKSSTASSEDNIVDFLGEVGNIAMGSGSTTLSTLLRKKVKITSPETSLVKYGDIKTKFENKQLLININYKKGLEGLNTFVLPSKMSIIISDLMMGGEGVVDENKELDDIALSAATEAMNQMMGSASTAMSEFLKTRVDIFPPETKIVDFSTEDSNFPPLVEDEEKELISIKFKMEIEGLESTTFWQFVPYEFAEKLFKLTQDNMEKEEAAKEEEKKKEAQKSAPQKPPQQPQQSQQQPQQQEYYDEFEDSLSDYSSPNLIDQGSEVTVNPVNFGNLEGNQPSKKEKVDMSKLQLLLDIPLNITVELGRVKMSLRDILELHEGSLIQLEKLAGEALDIYANGKLVARGEVVVIEENFGVRITEIVSLRERLRSLK